jgi:predicted glycoside hydrolase/deacetylase ChbG (UPF0249 family)
MQTAFLHRLDRDLVGAEARAQLDAFSALFGRPPDFVDGHQHVQLLPQVRDAVIAAVKERAPAAWMRQCAVVPAARRTLDAKGRIIDWLSRGFARRARAQQVAVNPAFAGTYAFRPDADFARLFPKFLAGLPEGGLVMCHPGTVDAELERLDPLTTLREREYAYFLADEFPRVLAENGMTLAAAVQAQQ